MIILNIICAIACAIVSVAVLLILFLALCALFAGNKEREKDSKFYRGLMNFYLNFLVFFSNVKITFNGEEKLKGLGRFLLVCNHRSNYDPIVKLQMMKKYKLAFLSKGENFNIPIVGRVIKRCCFMSIDRQNPRNAILTLRKSAQLIKDDQVSMCVYPEGTRSKDCSVLPLHDGVFKIAQNAQVPIVVATIKGTEQIRKNSPFKKTKVRLDVVRVIPTDEVLSKTSHELGDIVQKDFHTDLD